MSRRHYNLPPLTTLSAFEAAARHLSFKNAAQELSVTPGAVSHQIKALEGDLESILFRRRHRGVELTEDGQALYHALADSFVRISRSLDAIRQKTNKEKVTIGSTTAVAALWLSPAIIRFWRDYPELNVNQVSQDHPFVDRTDIDFFIRYGRDRDGRLSHTPLYRDRLVAIGSPELVASLGRAGIEALAQERLIHLSSVDESWTTWPKWFRELGYHGDVAVSTQVNSYSVALQLASKGAGLALGWERLIQPMLASGRLKTIEGWHLPAPSEFYLVGRPDEELSEQALALKSWILKEVNLPSV